MACKFIKMRPQHRRFSVNIAKFLMLSCESYGCFWSDLRKWLLRTFFLDGCFQNYPDLLILQKYQPLSNSFKHKLAYILLINLTAKLSWFCMFIINGYGRKSKRLQSLDFLFYKLQQKSENCKSNQQWSIKWNSKIFIFLKPKIKFDKFAWATRTCENIILYVLRFTATQCVKLGAKAKQAVYYCSTSESLSLSLEEQYLIITGSISQSTMWSGSLNFSYFYMICDTKLSQFFSESFLLQTLQIKSNTSNDSLL